MPETGSLTILGLGPARKEHITMEAMQALREAAREEHPTYALAHAREIIRSLVPALHPKSLDYLYSVPGVERPAAYQDLAAAAKRAGFFSSLFVSVFFFCSIFVTRNRINRPRGPAKPFHRSI